ncbi:ABC transporter ATP-binding protein [Candidatus Bipolaricaulota bacterium]|nr:ABC transporter ATP-binding protein [Candidatus Bipolaricaulota bacterium]
MEALLKVEDLKLYFRTTKGVVQAVDGVSFELASHTAMVIVGESGCGKSSLAKAILRLLPRNTHTYTGKIYIDGIDAMSLSDEQFRRQIRWQKISYVAQAAMNALNPVIKVGSQVAEPLLIHRRMRKEEALRKVVETFQIVGVPTDFVDRYPFELSGGMRQRAVIAMALVTNPKLVILDEPTSALDVLTQANIMNALKRIKEEFELTYILITHDIATSSELAERAMVMYAGQIVELGNAGHFYLEPLHPYSQKLMASVPTLREDKELDFIPGQPPSLINPPAGCRFAPRCHKRFSACDREPPMVDYKDGRKIKCHLYA